MNTILSTVIILGTYAWEKNSFFPFFFPAREVGFGRCGGVGVWGCGGSPQALIPDQCVQEKKTAAVRELHAPQTFAV